MRAGSLQSNAHTTELCKCLKGSAVADCLDLALELAQCGDDGKIVSLMTSFLGKTKNQGFKGQEVTPKSLYVGLFKVERHLRKRIL